ncbi:MAG: hypothetical protein K6T75_07295 [Acetobacteraceae bacterium]|nr:hypothetical protein [Acetobacteraceae bacterium]
MYSGGTIVVDYETGDAYRLNETAALILVGIGEQRRGTLKGRRRGDRIVIEGMEFWAHHGVQAFEAETGQPSGRTWKSRWIIFRRLLWPTTLPRGELSGQAAPVRPAGGKEWVGSGKTGAGRRAFHEGRVAGQDSGSEAGGAGPGVVGEPSLRG